MGEGAWLVAFLVVQRLAELAIAQRNTARLRAAGGVEFGAAHYPLLVALHSLWLFGLGMLGHDRAIDPFWLAVFILLQVGRLWVIASLASRWTTRVIVLPGSAGGARTLSLAAASELCGGRAGDRGGSAGARIAAVRACIFARQYNVARLPHPRREPGAGLGRTCHE